MKQFSVNYAYFIISRLLCLNVTRNESMLLVNLDQDIEKISFMPVISHRTNSKVTMWGCERGESGE